MTDKKRIKSNTTLLATFAFFRAAIISRDIFVCGMLCASLEPRAGVAQWNRYNTARALRRWQRCALKAAPAAQNDRVCGRKRPRAITEGCDSTLQDFRQAFGRLSGAGTLLVCFIGALIYYRGSERAGINNYLIVLVVDRAH